MVEPNPKRQKNFDHGLGCLEAWFNRKASVEQLKTCTSHNGVICDAGIVATAFGSDASDANTHRGPVCGSAEF